MKRNLIFGALLALGVLAVFAQSVGFDFLRLDDPDYTFRCAFVRNGFTFAGVAEAFTNFRHGGIWMPLTSLSYMADISLFGPAPWGHHLVNVLLHLAVTLLVFRLALLVAADRGNGSALLVFLGTAFWALHPQRAEAVAWIASRKELLWSFFALLGLLAWRREKTVTAIVCCALACLSKPTAMVFPFLALALDLILARRPKVLRYLPLLALAVATGLVAVYSQTHPEGMAEKELFTVSFPMRILNAVKIIGYVVAQNVWPAGIHLDYRAGADDFFWMAGAAGVLTALIRLFRREGRLQNLALLLWFAAAIGPTLGLFGNFGEQLRADRFIYVPMMAWPLALALVSRQIGLNAVCFGAYAAAFLYFGFVQVRTYRNDVTVFERTIACDPENGRALVHLGEAKCAKGDLFAGIEMLRKSRAVRPLADTDAKLAYALMRRGTTYGAEKDFAEIRTVCAAVAANPELDEKGQALEALGTAALHAHDWTNAAEWLYLSVAAPQRFYSPEDAKLKLAFAWHNCGRRADAKRILNQLAESRRADISARAKTTLIAVYENPDVLLIW